MHDRVEKIIGELLRESGTSRDLGVNINALAPEYLQVIRSRLPKRQATQNEFPPRPNSKFNAEFSTAAQKLLEGFKTLQKGYGEIRRRDEIIQQILAKMISRNLTKSDRLSGGGIEQLTKDNLTLLEREGEGKRTKAVPQVSSPPGPVLRPNTRFIT